MKKLTIILSVFAILFINQNNVFAQNTKEALAYMSDITDVFKELKGETWQYLKAVTKGKGAKKVESKRIALLNEIKTVKATVSRKGAFENDESLKSSVIEYLDLSYTVLKEDFDKILDMEEIAEQSYDMMEAYLLAKEKAGDKLNGAFDMVQQAQKTFADKYSITLLEAESDKVSQKIEKANKALKYYNQVYLIFFKCYKQELYTLDALNKGDVNGLEQNTKTLLTFANEELEKLKEVKPFSGDASLVTTVKQMLTFYKAEAEKDFPAMTDFFIKKDNFEKVQKAVESKNKKDRTKQDIDQYNAASKEYNEAVMSYNKINETANTKRSTYLEQWNQKVDKFFELHTN